MKFLKNIILLTFIVGLYISCKNETKAVIKTEVKELAATLKKSEFHIKGMTCEIGCAKLIQSRLSKIDGVKFVEVSFKDSLGMVEYDTNKLTSKKIRTIVDKIADGDLYKVTDLKEVTTFSIK